jgi:ABC-type nitrate/sulfonate/bicarbonate transport system substrate-binding protein
MGSDPFLENFMTRRYLIFGLSAAILVVIISSFAYFHRGTREGIPLRVGISPYQDIAMIVNAQPLGLDRKYGTQLELITLSWEDILPSVASAGKGLDIGFGSLIEYLTKQENINAGSNDPILFVYPLYVFKGGAFVTFKSTVVPLTKESLASSENVKMFLANKIGAQRHSVYEMMLYYLATSRGIPPSTLNIVDTPLDQGFLAAQNGSLDIAEAGLTQLTEARRNGGRSVLNMEDLGFADITGIIVKESVYKARKHDIDNFIHMWFESVNYVLSDIDNNSKASLAYLNANASTRYSLNEYKLALSQEFFPRSASEAATTLIEKDGKFSYRRISQSVTEYLVVHGSVKNAPTIPEIQPK